jgi:glucose uptake protein GlcU
MYIPYRKAYLTGMHPPSREILFWLLVAGFVWVVGDLFQQYAAKYVGISRGIPLSTPTSCGDSCGGCSCSASWPAGAAVP